MLFPTTLAYRGRWKRIAVPGCLTLVRIERHVAFQRTPRQSALGAIGPIFQSENQPPSLWMGLLPLILLKLHDSLINSCQRRLPAQDF